MDWQLWIVKSAICIWFPNRLVLFILYISYRNYIAYLTLFLLHFDGLPISLFCGHFFSLKPCLRTKNRKFQVCSSVLLLWAALLDELINRCISLAPYIFVTQRQQFQFIFLMTSVYYHRKYFKLISFQPTKSPSLPCVQTICCVHGGKRLFQRCCWNKNARMLAGEAE